jgi:hypothetical protein
MSTLIKIIFFPKCRILDNHVGIRKIHLDSAWLYSGSIELSGGDTEKLNQDECKFAFLSLIKSPIIVTNDLNSLTPRNYELLGNDDILKVHQDDLASVGMRVYHEREKGLQFDIWSVDLMDNKSAVLIVNRGDQQIPWVQIDFQDLGFQQSEARIYDLYKRKLLGEYKGSIKTTILEPTSCIFYKLEPF